MIYSFRHRNTFSYILREGLYEVLKLNKHIDYFKLERTSQPGYIATLHLS
jgi:hypothetical protein